MEINPTKINQSLSQFLHRYHVIIFVVTVLGALSAGIFIVYQDILSVDDPHGYTSQTNNTSFDASTSKRLEQLHASDYRLSSGDSQKDASVEKRDLTISGRTNPFVE
jgi:hypothetical protein